MQMECVLVYMFEEYCCKGESSQLHSVNVFNDVLIFLGYKVPFELHGGTCNQKNLISAFEHEAKGRDTNF